MSSEPRAPLPANKFSLDYAVALWDQISKCDIKDPSEAPWLIESLRSAAEIALWGDKNDAEVADFLIMESTMVSYIADVVDTPNLDNTVYAQCIQCVVMLLQNHSRESTLFFILSNGKFNRIIEANLDYSDEDVVSLFVSFLKTVTIRLKAKNIIPLFCSGNSFPLLGAAMHSALLTHDDRMVRTSVRQVIGQLLRIEDEAVATFAQGCVPRLVDDLGAFLEAQLRNLSIYIGDENVSQVAVEMNDEDIADEGLYLIDLLAGCTTETEKRRMARTVRECVLERLLTHAHEANSADVVVSTVVFIFLARWLRSAPKWFLESCFQYSPSSPSTTTVVVVSAATAETGGSDNNKKKEEEEGEEKNQGEKEKEEFSPGSFVSATPILTRSLAWALFALNHQVLDEGVGGTGESLHALHHHPASTVTRSAICILGTVFNKFCVASASSSNYNSHSHPSATSAASSSAAEQQEYLEWDKNNDTLQLLVQLIKDSLVGMAARLDRTSCYNCAAMYSLAGRLLGQDAPELRLFFHAVIADSDLLAPEQSSLRLEVLMILSSSQSQAAALPPESSLDVLPRDQWQTFIEDLRSPHKRHLKFREPISQQERVTHRASIITFLRNRLVASSSSSSSSSKKNLIRPCEKMAKLLFEFPDEKTKNMSVHQHFENDHHQRREKSNNNNNNNSKAITIPGILVNEEISPDGGLPSVFLVVSGNMLRVIRVEFGETSGVFQKQHQGESSSSSSIQDIPLVALQISLDVSRPFVVHFCLPQCCGVAPFSVSFVSRKVAGQVMDILSEAGRELRDKVQQAFFSELSLNQK